MVHRTLEILEPFMNSNALCYWRSFRTESSPPSPPKLHSDGNQGRYTTTFISGKFGTSQHRILLLEGKQGIRLTPRQNFTSEYPQFGWPRKKIHYSGERKIDILAEANEYIHDHATYSKWAELYGYNELETGTTFTV